MHSRFGKEEEDAVLEVIRSGRLSSFYRQFLGGNKVREFEETFAQYHGAKYAITTTSGTSALHVALLACGIKSGNEVITTPYTFVSTASMILACGAKPVFVDVDPKTYNLDPEKINEALTENTWAILPVHLLGQPAEMDAIMEIAEDNGLFVIEDCAQALGAEYKGHKVGTIGTAGCFSFQETKILSTLGEGGCVITNDPETADLCQKIRNHGEKYAKAEVLGYNYRMTEIQAAVGVEQLKKLDFFLNWQIKNAETLIPLLPKGITPPYVSPDVRHVFSFLGCLYNEEEVGIPREQMIKRLTDIGWNKLQPAWTVGTGYAELVYQLSLFRKFARPCPVAEELLKKAFWLDLIRFPHTQEAMRNLALDMERIIEGGEKTS